MPDDDDPSQPERKPIPFLLSAVLGVLLVLFFIVAMFVLAPRA